MSSLRWAVVGLCGVATFGALHGCRREGERPVIQVAAPRHVVLICLDTVRADHLGCYGYEKRPTSPRLDALAAESIFFEDASASACWTKPSVPSFLTSLHAAQHGVYDGSASGGEGAVTDLLPERARTLAEEFESRGYRTAAFVHNAQLHLGSGIEQGFDRYVEGDADAEKLCSRALEWIDEQESDRPLFVYVHVLDAHYPYDVPDAYARRFADGTNIGTFRTPEWKQLRDDVNDGHRVLTAEEHASLVALYDGSIRYTDDQLALFFDELEERGLWKNSVVSVVADHGEEFLEHGKIGHGHGLYENLLRVPWILRIPGEDARRVSEHVSLIDLFPTLIEAAGLAPPAIVSSRLQPEGVSRIAPAPEHPIFAEHLAPGRYSQSWREGTKKLVRHFVPMASSLRRIAALTDIVESGTRWEIEFELDADGKPRATKVAPREEPPDDPSELQGPIARGSDGIFRVAGRVVNTRSTTELYGEVQPGTTLANLADGTMVKIVGEFSGNELLARKIKLYGADRKPEYQLRGAIGSFTGDHAAGVVRIGSMDVAWDAKTRWGLDAIPDGSDRLQRMDLVPLLEHGAARARALGFEVETFLFDLAADPQELRPLTDAPEIARMTAGLEKHAAGLARRRCYRAEDRARLSGNTIDQLRRLGYTR